MNLDAEQLRLVFLFAPNCDQIPPVFLGFVQAFISFDDDLFRFPAVIGIGCHTKGHGGLQSFSFVGNGDLRTFLSNLFRPFYSRFQGGAGNIIRNSSPLKRQTISELREFVFRILRKYIVSGCRYLLHLLK